MNEIVLRASQRKVLGKGVNRLRQEGILPAVLYGSDIKTKPIQVDYKNFDKVYQQAGESTLVDLLIDEKKPIKTIIQSVEHDPLTGNFIHVDFYQVDLTKIITTEINLVFEGEAPAIKELNGVLIKSLDHVKVECLPQDLVHEIKVDISGLKTFEDIIYIKNIKIPANIKLLEKDDETVVLVKPPRTEEELKALDEKVEEKVEEVAVVEKEKVKEETTETEESVEISATDQKDNPAK